MSFLPRLFSRERWDWEPEIPSLPFPLWLKRGACILLISYGIYIISLLQAPLGALMDFLFF